ncbi:hypothetical protein SAMN05216257_103221 [Meinhardsimonia xiamenensis]|jgi:uncharacterized protein YigA (DUF484 family)|uniref:Recombinase XerC n=1 Tax=Meinhardsimonia xiamenensis TaxID=990712 RepID=A0A1G9CT74_9RHOB|nr:DUF484 family protein [Meinhardsimonia xiamenensis]PRX38253.1 hypothetical protein LV81_00533 [Meinhardsimonia xiamenensis]SDK54883.1 hypothetical protein SAMN05216257_103221 [Meinhardsimonia xiamenensis]
MTGSNLAEISDDLRARILSDPEVILEDPEVMAALVAANERLMGGNIVDLRGVAMERLEARLKRLEETHAQVIAAAYENLAGTNRVHRAVLRLMEATEFEDFLACLSSEMPELLRVQAIRLVVETEASPDDPAVRRLGDVLTVADPGFIEGYLTQGRNVPARQVTLRQLQPDSEVIYGAAVGWVRSEACLRLDFGPGNLPGMLCLGAEDPHQFKPSQGTDLLAFFAGVFERLMRRWLA